MVYTAEVYYVMCVWGELPYPEAYGFTDAKYPGNIEYIVEWLIVLPVLNHCKKYCSYIPVIPTANNSVLS
jgi:hypothetical protein